MMDEAPHQDAQAIDGAQQKLKAALDVADVRIDYLTNPEISAVDGHPRCAIGVSRLIPAGCCSPRERGIKQREIGRLQGLYPFERSIETLLSSQPLEVAPETLVGRQVLAMSRDVVRIDGDFVGRIAIGAKRAKRVEIADLLLVVGIHRLRLEFPVVAERMQEFQNGDV
jgi:hypothetical protein